jgi:hypothetical protein
MKISLNIWLCLWSHLAPLPEWRLRNFYDLERAYAVHGYAVIRRIILPVRGPSLNISHQGISSLLAAECGIALAACRISVGLVQCHGIAHCVHMNEEPAVFPQLQSSTTVNWHAHWHFLCVRYAGIGANHVYKTLLSARLSRCQKCHAAPSSGATHWRPHASV